MINPSLLIFISVCYITILFWIAYNGDKKPVGQYSFIQPVLFTLSLAVYCSSWTFFGAVGTAANNGWTYFSIYLGPILLFIFGYRFFEKIIQVSKQEKITTIADFISSRYGKSSILASLVTIIALIGTIPYISLQLKAVSSAFDTLAGRADNVQQLSFFADTSLYLSIFLILFAILFGARCIDATEHHRGLMSAISFESIVKLITLIIIAIYAWQLLDENDIENLTKTYKLSPKELIPKVITPSFFTNTLLAGAAIICLPRQFHVFAVESRGNEMPFARWGFSAYLLIVSIAVIPITLAGVISFNGSVNSDLFILFLPMENNAKFLAALVYIGGFSAATGMVIVAAVALSTMVSNDLILPMLLKFHKKTNDFDYFPFLLWTRRITICGLIIFAYCYHRITNTSESLASIGLISFVAVAQFLPAMIGSIYWRKGHRYGVMVGLIVGFILWVYTLLLPVMAESAWLPKTFIEQGLFGFDFLKPQNLFYSNFDNQLTHSVFWSLSLNIICFFLISLFAKPSLTDKMQATAFIDGIKTKPHKQKTFDKKINIADLMEVCDRFVGKERTRLFFYNLNFFSPRYNKNIPIDIELINKVEKLLSSTVGASSARSILYTTLKANNDNDDILNILTQTTQAIKFNRELLQVTLDNLSQGVSVVDKELRLIAWNRTYLELFKYPKGYIHIGMPIEKIIRYNFKREFFELNNISEEDFLNKRMNYLRHGSNYSFERKWKKNNIVIKTQGNRLPDGGYVSTYTDITNYKNIQNALELAKKDLENKVKERTDSLSILNVALKEAKSKAEDGTISKTKFLAAASHDLLQPLNAGKLFLGALLEDLEENTDQFELACNIKKSLNNAEGLLRALLDISKLDAGALKPDFSNFPLSDVLSSLERDFFVLAKENGLKLKIYKTSSYIYSDKNLLRSILQNFIGNAIRYTPEGKVIVVCRKRKDNLLIQVRDNGPGIPKDKQAQIFEEFNRLHKKDNIGFGLGLAISNRIAKLLDVKIGLRSKPMQGSTFSITVPIAKYNRKISEPPALTHKNNHFSLRGLKVLCVDDDKHIIEATVKLLTRWGCDISTAQNIEQCYTHINNGNKFDVILADYQLNDNLNGFELLIKIKKETTLKFKGVIVSAEHNKEIHANIRNSGFLFLQKPLEPSVLRTILTKVNKSS